MFLMICPGTNVNTFADGGEESLLHSMHTHTYTETQNKWKRRTMKMTGMETSCSEWGTHSFPVIFFPPGNCN